MAGNRSEYACSEFFLVAHCGWLGGQFCLLNVWFWQPLLFFLPQDQVCSAVVFRARLSFATERCYFDRWSLFSASDRNFGSLSDSSAPSEDSHFPWEPSSFCRRTWTQSQWDVGSRISDCWADVSWKRSSPFFWSYSPNPPLLATSVCSRHSDAESLSTFH